MRIEGERKAGGEIYGVLARDQPHIFGPGVGSTNSKGPGGE